LKEKLSLYRRMIDRMVSQKKEMLIRRIEILGCCNSYLVENYLKTSRMYLDLVKTRAYEAAIYPIGSGSEMRPPNESHFTAV